MNPRVRPSSKNDSVLQGKMVVFSKLNEEITSLLKEADKSAPANYDLRLLDVVSAKSTSAKKHVHFLPDRTSVSPTKFKEQDGKITKTISAEKKDSNPSTRFDQKCFKDLASQSGSSSSSSSLQIDDEKSEISEISNPKFSGQQTSTRHISSPRFQKKQTNQRNNTHSLEESKRAQNTNNEHHNKNVTSKESVQYGKPKPNRYLPSTPTKATKTPLTSPSTRKSVKHKSTTVTKKDTISNQTVRFADPVSSSHKDRSISNEDFNIQSSELTENTNQNSVVSEKEEQNTNKYVNGSHSLKSSLPIRRKIPATDESSRPLKINDSTTSIYDSQSNQCTQTKYVTSSISNEPEVPERRPSIGWQSRLDQSKHDPNHVNRCLSNSSLSSNISSTPLKRINQSKNDSQQEVMCEDNNLTSAQSSLSLNKDAKPANLYDLSSVLSTVFAKLPRDENLSAGFKQMSASTSGALSSTVATTFKFKTQRSASCLDKDCLYRNTIDCTTSTNLAQNAQKSALSTAFLGKNRGATLSDLEPNSSSALIKKFDQSLLPFGNTKYRNMATLVKKESIAASYQLDYCWFCGRPMATCGVSDNDSDDLLQKLADLKRLLAEAEVEKIKLLEEQAKLRNSKMVALQKNEALEKELKQIKMKDNNEQKETTRPATSALSNTIKDFDLRAHLESSGHQLDICPHILVFRHICRGFLHKMGGRFKMWRKWWFVLDITKRKVLYFTDKTETKLKGSISLHAIDEVYVDHHRIVRSPSPKLTFCVKTCERTYQFVAPSPDTMTIWVDALFSVAEGYHRMVNSCQDEFGDKNCM